MHRTSRLACVAALILVSLLTTTRADPPPVTNGLEVGGHVATRYGMALDPDVPQAEPNKSAPKPKAAGQLPIYRVEKAEKDRLLLVDEASGQRGWAKMTQVLSLSDAIKYVNSEIKARPSDPNPLVDRGKLQALLARFDIAIDDDTLAAIEARSEVYLARISIAPNRALRA